MNSDVTPCAWICILKPPVPFCSSAEPLHFLFYNLCAIIDSPVSQWAIHVCTNRIIWLWWWCCRSSGVRPKRIAETETGWEELGGLLGLMGGEERCQWGGGTAGFIVPHMLCTAAPMWCTQQQPPPVCTCRYRQCSVMWHPVWDDFSECMFLSCALASSCGCATFFSFLANFFVKTESAPFLDNRTCRLSLKKWSCECKGEEKSNQTYDKTNNKETIWTIFTLLPDKTYVRLTSCLQFNVQSTKIVMQNSTLLCW